MAKDLFVTVHNGFFAFGTDSRPPHAKVWAHIGGKQCVEDGSNVAKYPQIVLYISPVIRSTGKCGRFFGGMEKLEIYPEFITFYNSHHDHKAQYKDGNHDVKRRHVANFLLEMMVAGELEARRYSNTRVDATYAESHDGDVEVPASDKIIRNMDYAAKHVASALIWPVALPEGGSSRKRQRKAYSSDTSDGEFEGEDNDDDDGGENEEQDGASNEGEDAQQEHISPPDVATGNFAHDPSISVEGPTD